MIGPTAAEHRAHQIDGRTTAGVGAASAARRLLSVAALLEILCFLTITFVAAVVGAWPIVATIRPQVFSMVFFTALLFVLTRSRDDVRWVWALPPLFALWVNVHGGWLVGAGVLGIFAAWAPFDKAFSARG